MSQNNAPDAFMPADDHKDTHDYKNMQYLIDNHPDHIVTKYAYKVMKEQTEVKSKEPWHEKHQQTAQGAKDLITSTTSILNGVQKLTQKNTSGLEMAIGVCDIVGGALMGIPTGPFTPYTKLAGSLVSLVGACLGFGLAKGPSMEEEIQKMINDLKKYIKESFDDYKNDDILESFTVSSRKYQTAVTFLESLITAKDIRQQIEDLHINKDESTKQFISQKLEENDIFTLKQAELPLLTSIHYRVFGLDILGILEAQINKYKDCKDKRKKKYVA
eukprot:45116_1